MFSKKSSNGYNQMLEGIHRKTLVHGRKTLLTEFKIAKGSKIPMHNHPHEQTGYLVSGCLRFILKEKTVDCEPGDSWCFAGDLDHSAEALEDSVIVEVFAPVREEYLP